MSSLEELEAWREADEGERVQLATVLSRRLHDVERRLERLHAEAHRLVCEAGGIPLEDKVARLHELLQAELPELDLTPIAQDASWLAKLKSGVADCERRIAKLVPQRHGRHDGVAGHRGPPATFSRQRR
jgi:hypothetical protein